MAVPDNNHYQQYCPLYVPTFIVLIVIFPFWTYKGTVYIPVIEYRNDMFTDIFSCSFLMLLAD